MKRYVLKFTKNYSQFEPYPFNRDVDNTKRLEESMKKHGFDPGYPLRCVQNGVKLRITSGHHRFDVAQKLNVGVWYIVCDNDISLFEGERSSNYWNMRDYVTGYARSGDDDYMNLKKYSEKTGIPLLAAAHMLRGHGRASGGMLSNQIASGKYQIGQTDHAKIVASVVSCLEELGVSFCKHSSFLTALSMMILAPGFDPDVFMKKARTHVLLFEKCRSTKDYLNLLAEIMNYQAPTKKKKPWVYLAEQASRERNIAHPESKTRGGK